LAVRRLTKELSELQRRIGVLSQERESLKWNLFLRLDKENEIKKIEEQINQLQALGKKKQAEREKHKAKVKSLK